MTESFRSLSSSDISVLESRGCSSGDWSRVLVSPGFRPERLSRVRLSGDILLGSFEGETELSGGLVRACGLEDVTLHNCTVGERVLIRNVARHIANYDIEEGVIIEDLRILTVEGRSSFGNGVRVSVINEAGGREIPIYNHLSSHLAYIIALYRHDRPLLDRLEELVGRYVEAHTSDRGSIGRGTRIFNAGILRNLRIGEYALVEGASRLENGTILSKKECPAYVGSNVIAQDFIFATDSRVEENTIVRRCFVGQATELGRQYSAENSVFFANCGGYHGEACSIFAGPYTVTHHKSTLLIAGLFSFLNAGSGSNQSNHMYKLGPVHQGIVERGSKTGSDSYLLWPMRVGAFTLIMGRHTGNSDTTDLPFSYLIEDNGESVLVPGVNLRSVGTIRDAQKWPLRDRRRDGNLTDFITFNLITPYTCDRMLRGIRLLSGIRDAAGFSSQNFYYNGVKIRRSALEKGVQLYRLGIRRYLGNVVVSLLRSAPITGRKELAARFRIRTPQGAGEWLDFAGLYLPRPVAEEFLERIRTGRLDSMKAIHDQLKEYHDSFADYELAWVNRIIREERGKELSDFLPEDFCALITDWIDAVEQLDILRCDDARKEFSQTSRMGFGVDGDGREEVRDGDFLAVRGSAEENGFIRELEDRLALKKGSAAELVETLSRL